MKVILEPKVTVVASSKFHEHDEYKIPSDGGDAVQIGSFAAKGCYDSYGETGRPNIENQLSILEHKHGSVLEHIHYSLFIEGITRGLSLELNRHRTFNISQRSTRYTKEEDAAIVLDPYYASLFKKYHYSYRYENQQQGYGYNKEWMPNIQPAIGIEAKESLMLYRFLNSCEDSILQYTSQIELLEALNPLQLKGFDLRKWARGKARSLLPHALETRGTYSNNIRGWRWFVEARSSRHAEPEIRVLADKVVELLAKEAPIYFADFKRISMYDGIPEWKPEYSKV
jgi:thymidylate synthase (FAD)